MIRRDYKANEWNEVMKEKTLCFEAKSQELSIEMDEEGVAVESWKIFPVSTPLKVNIRTIYKCTSTFMVYMC